MGSVEPGEEVKGKRIMGREAVMPPFPPTARILVEEAQRRYKNERWQIGLEELQKAGVRGCSPAEMEAAYKECDRKAGGAIVQFRAEFALFAEHFARTHPEKFDPTIIPVEPPGITLAKAFPRDEHNEPIFDEEVIMGDTDRLAQQSIATWLSRSSTVFLDTETTGVSDKDVPISLGAISNTGEVLAGWKIRPLDGAGNIIPVSDSAFHVNGITTTEAVTYSPFEMHLAAMEALVSRAPVFFCYNFSFDRKKILTMFDFATQRAIRANDHRLQERLEVVRAYLHDTTHWCECKEVFAAACGLDRGQQGSRYVKLIHCARVAGLIKDDEEQAHGAVEDALLLYGICKHYESIHQPTKEAPVTIETTSQTIVPQSTAPIIPPSVMPLTTISLPAPQHPEAPVVAYTDLIINGHKICVTARSGSTAQDVYDTVMTALFGGLRMIRADEQVKEYAAITGRDTINHFKSVPKVAENGARANDNGAAHATPQATPAPTNVAPISTTSEGISEGTPGFKFEKIVKIKKVFSEDGDPAYQLWSPNEGLKFPQWTVRDDEANAHRQAEYNMLAAALKERWDEIEGARKGEFPVSLSVKYKLSEQVNSKGNPYRDIVSISPLSLVG
jgi:DNA polymerase III epsilon subunit-like protein